MIERLKASIPPEKRPLALFIASAALVVVILGALVLGHTKPPAARTLPALAKSSATASATRPAQHGSTATPTATPADTSPPTSPAHHVHPGLGTTASNVHLGLVFNSLVANPATERGVVDVVWGSSTPTQPAGVYNIAYNPFDRIGNGANFRPLFTFAWFQANHPTWIEYQCDRSTPAYFPGEPNTPLDITNPAVLQFLMAQEYTPQLQAGYDGIGFDNVAFFSVAQRCGHFDAGHTWVQQFTGQFVDPPYRASVLQWSQTIYQMLHAAKAGVSVGMNFSYEFPNEDASAQLLQNIDFLTDERGFTNFGSANGADSLYLSDQNWQDYVNALQRYTADGGAVLLIDEEPSPSISRAQLQWALANYLMVKGQYTYLTVVGQQQYGQFYDHPEYHAPIGTPTGGISTDQCVFRRDYSGGTAIVNPSSALSCPVSLPAGAFKDLYGAPVSAFTLAPHTAVVLLRA